MRKEPGSNLKGGIGLISLTTLTLVWVFPVGRRRWKRTFFSLCCLGILVVGIGCGGGGSNSGAGNYTITVNATDSSNSNITASTTFTLTVQ